MGRRAALPQSATLSKVKVQLKVKKVRLEEDGASSSVWNMDKAKSLCMVGLAQHKGHYTEGKILLARCNFKLITVLETISI